jgi:transporter family protein
MKWILVAAIAIATTAGDVLQTHGMKRMGEVRDFSPRAIFAVGHAIVRTPMMLASIACLAVAFFALVALMSMTDLSFAVPATASSYVLETLLASRVLHEDVTWRRWLGAALVACGVGLLSA